jgi:hypothetical protein
MKLSCMPTTRGSAGEKPLISDGYRRNFPMLSRLLALGRHMAVEIACHTFA